MEDLTIEQKIVRLLARKGYITKVGDVTKALKDVKYAEKLIIGTSGEIPDINDDGTIADCEHKALTTDEIQQVFDNDNESKSL